MRFRHDATTRAERLASFAIASGITVAAVAVIFVALVRSEVFRTFVDRSDNEAPRERVVFVTAAPPPPIATAPTSARPVSARQAVPSTAPTGVVGAPRVDTTSLTAAPAAPAASAPVGSPPLLPAVAPAGAPISSSIVGATRPRDSLMVPIGPGEFKKLPPTQAEVDAKLRDQALDAAVARSRGEAPRTLTGMSIPVGLPLGGPSNKQRERDRILGAELAAMRAQRQKRIDSVVAARRLADSIARVIDPSRRDTLDE